MNYIVTKREPKWEWRIYKDSEEKIEGQIIYKGHKLAIEHPLLSKILDYRIEKKTGNIFTLKYDKVKELHDHTDLTIWEIGKDQSFQKNLMKSWESLQLIMKQKMGNFRKIIITKVNI